MTADSGNAAVVRPPSNGRGARFIKSTWGAIALQMLAFAIGGGFTAWAMFASVREDLRFLRELTTFIFCTSVPENSRAQGAVFGIDCIPYEQQSSVDGVPGGDSVPSR